MSLPSDAGMEGAREVRSQQSDSMMMITMLGRFSISLPGKWRRYVKGG